MQAIWKFACAECLLALLLTCLWAPCLLAGTITVTAGDEHISDGNVMIDADADIRFGEDAIKAIDSGVPITIDFDVRVSRPRKFFWDTEILNAHREFTIERHALSKQYIVADRVTGIRRIHGSLQLAIDDLGRIRNIPIADAQQVGGAGDLIFAIRLRIAIRSLPGPLIPVAYISPSWRMSSGWFRWQTRQ
jgi:Domain of unknown function (DUF4390)